MQAEMHIKWERNLDEIDSLAYHIWNVISAIWPDDNVEN
jgi:hypothetical protein